MLFFFFSSRRRHTRCSRDWSSDVCSSDLLLVFSRRARRPELEQMQLTVKGLKLDAATEGQSDYRSGGQTIGSFSRRLLGGWRTCGNGPIRGDAVSQMGADQVRNLFGAWLV